MMVTITNMASQQMSIGDLARRTGVRTSTIRFYERLGLIEAEGRTGGNYRSFGPRAEERLRFIRAAKASGLSLAEVKALCQFDGGVTRPCKEVLEVIDRRLDEVTQQMKHLRHIQRVLRTYREACLKTPRGKACPVLNDLRGQRTRS
jgi:MerR family mercuric resistance operon transcriptional regulator